MSSGANVNVTVNSRVTNVGLQTWPPLTVQGCFPLLRLLRETKLVMSQLVVLAYL